MQEEDHKFNPVMARTRTPSDGALVRRVIHVNGGHRTIRIAAYPKRPDQKTGITFGIGYGDANRYSKINFEVTEEDWYEIDKAVKEAFRVATGKVPKTKRQSRRRNLPKAEGGGSGTKAADPKPLYDPPDTQGGVGPASHPREPAASPSEPSTGSRKRQAGAVVPGLLSQTE